MRVRILALVTILRTRVRILLIIMITRITTAVTLGRQHRQPISVRSGPSPGPEGGRGGRLPLLLRLPRPSMPRLPIRLPAYLSISPLLSLRPSMRFYNALIERASPFALGRQAKCKRGPGRCKDPPSGASEGSDSSKNFYYRCYHNFYCRCHSSWS